MSGGPSNQELGIGLAIAGSVFAPELAPAFLEEAMGATAATALTGAALGGASSYLTGGNPLTGAVTGGIGGAIAGAPAGTFSSMFGGTAAEAPIAGGLGATFEGATNPEAIYQGLQGTMGDAMATGPVGISPDQMLASAPPTSDVTPVAVNSVQPASSAPPIDPRYPYGTGTDGSVSAQASQGVNAINPKVAAPAPSPKVGGIRGLWNDLGGWGQAGVIGAGGLGLYGMMSADNKRYGTPAPSSYSGPLSKFSYNPNTYTPNYATPNVYQPHYAGGGPVEDMSNQNTMGNNQNFPGAKSFSASFSQPTVAPQPQNVVNGVQDVGTDPYTGVQNMAEGGVATDMPVNEWAFAPGGKYGMGEGGGSGLASGGATNDHMQAIDDYVEAAQQPGGLQTIMAKAKSGDYNAMIALNKIHNTPNQNYAGGGTAHGGLGAFSDGGQMLKGPGDGMSDSIPGTIAGKQPARLANDEFVVPADVVSHLGNGSSDAGANKLYGMMSKVRKARTGSPKQGKQIKADKYLPS